MIVRLAARSGKLADDAATLMNPGVAETYWVSRSGTTDPMLGVATSSSTNSRTALYNGYDLDIYYSGGDFLVFDVQQSSGNSAVNHQTDTFHAGIWQVIWSATGSQTAYSRRSST